MTEQEILESLELEKGKPPMTPGQLQRRIQAFTESKWPWAAKERDPAGYEVWKESMSPTLAAAEAAFAFNHALAAYRAAQQRLAKYRLADGHPAVFADVETGGFDEIGNPIVEALQVQAEIEPLPATVEEPEHDPETGEFLRMVDVPNPAIVKDDAERAEAQAVIDGTPQEVIDFTQDV